MEKKEMRRRLLSIRRGLRAEHRAEKSKQIVRFLLRSEFYRNARLIFCFVPFGHEVNIREIIDHSMKDGKQVAVPKTFMERKEIVPFLFEGWDQLKEGPYGIQEPDPALAQIVNPEDIDLMIMPGVAFDRKGGRLGYGGGYYDRFLQSLQRIPPLVAVAYAEQLVEDIPMEDHDYRVDLVITDQGVIRCSKTK